MTWNIWWRFGPKWQERQSVLVETLRAVDPDVVALQEVWGTDETTQAHEFAASLGLHAGFAEPSYPAVPDPPQVADHDGVTLGLGVLSRWPIKQWFVIFVGLRRELVECFRTRSDVSLDSAQNHLHSRLGAETEHAFQRAE